MVPRRHGLWLGGPCWGVISVFLGGRFLARLPSAVWSRGYPRRRGKARDIMSICGIFCLKKKGNWSASSKASCHTTVEANGQGPAWWCGGWLTWCQVLRYQIDLSSGREFIERPESRQPDAEEGRKPPRNPRIEILSESRASYDSTGDVCAPSCWARRNTDLRGREVCPPTAVQEVATPC
ncbi:hypothetical protein B0T18DRAFT_250129 [Schizothecium vesticola]|uniref:Uncharacterized protein n=1 Tax=Schizothecium vesticola TaxID=314040 RepID=A0AA40BQM6_9PEZI|nr:hypothetical protein B0T18DRAFT_250129 [Schizothecium vesticola]